MKYQLVVSVPFVESLFSFLESVTSKDGLARKGKYQNCIFFVGKWKIKSSSTSLKKKYKVRLLFRKMCLLFLKVWPTIIFCLVKCNINSWPSFKKFVVCIEKGPNPCILFWNFVFFSEKCKQSFVIKMKLESNPLPSPPLNVFVNSQMFRLHLFPDLF